MSFKIYDPDQVSIVAMGIPISDGYADGEFVVVANAEDAFTMKVGTDGSVTRSKTNNNTGSVTIKLMQSADANTALSALHNLDKAAPNGAGVGPLLIKDRSGTSLYAASKAWIGKAPDAPFDREATPREWRIDCADLVRLDGGN